MKPALCMLALTGGILLFAEGTTTAAAQTSLPADSTRVVTDSAGREAAPASFHPTKSPWLAVGLSAALPGAGQIYDAGYWKVPVIWGLGVYWLYEWRQLNTQYQDFRARYLESLQQSPGGNPIYLHNRDFYHDERDKFAWFLGGLYLLNLVDAYVGAHLYDFNVSPDLSDRGTIVPRVTATIRFRF